MKKVLLILLTLFITAQSFSLFGCEGGAGSGNVSDMAEVWSTYGDTSVFQNQKDDVSYFKFDSSLSVSMMKDEREGAQLVLTAKKDIAEYELIGADLKTDDGKILSKDNITIYHQKYITITKRANAQLNPHYVVGDYIPDMLLNMDKAVEYKENNIKKGENQSIYIDVATTKDTPAGTYKGNFTLKVDGAEMLIPVSVTVWDFGFEGKSDFESIFLLYTWGLLHGEYNCSDEIIMNYMDMALDYNFCIYPVGEFDYNAEEEVEVYDGFIDYVVENYEKSAFNTIIVPIALGGDFKAYSTNGQPSGDSQNILKYLTGLLELSSPTKPYLDNVVFYVSGLDEADMRPADWEKSKKVFGVGGEIDQLYDYLASEIQKNSYYKNFSAEYQNSIDVAVANIPMVFTNVGFMSDAVGIFDSATFCPLIDNFADPIQASKYEYASELYNNNELWVYTCNGCQYPYPSFHIDDYNYGNRVAGWMYKYYNLDGYLYWQTAQYYPSAYGFDTFLDPYTMAGRSGLIWNGEGCLFYPGGRYGSDYPFPSARMVTYRDSIDDYNMICLLEDLLNEYTTRKGVPAIDVNDYLGDIYASLFCNAEYYQDESLVYLAREKVAQMITSLKNGVLIENNKTAVTINDFASDTLNIEKTAGSTLSVDNNVASVCIKSVDRGDENRNKKYSTYVQFRVNGLQDAKNIRFNIKNTTGTNIEFEIGFITSDGMNNYAGGVFLPKDKAKDVKVYFNKSLESRLSNVKYVRLYFDNTTYDAGGNLILSPDYSFEISNLIYEK